MANAVRTPQQIEMEMEAFDAMPKAWRAFAWEYGMDRTKLFRAHGHTPDSAFEAMRADWQDFLEEVEFFLT